MPIHLRENQYRGVNAHLHSALQTAGGGWESFHTDYITYLLVALDAQLPPGYLAASEKSLQISEVSPSGTSQQRTTPDITLYRARPSSRPAPASQPASAPTATLLIKETLEEDIYLDSVIVYQTGEGTLLGRPITRIELLSPANKPSGSHYPQYRMKRFETLQSNLRLVEIDYWHESRPVIRGVPSYPDREPEAAPYTIVVTDPRPSLDQGQSQIYSFEVDAAIPVILIPLAGADEMTLDLGTVYNQFFQQSRLCSELVDYEQFPVRFETYSPTDQQRIRDRMAEVAAQFGQMH